MGCKNCNSQLATDSRYCALCGNKVITKRLTVKRVITEFNTQFFDYDNKFLKTFIHLFTKPEVVINSFIEGSRKTYVNVISYLALSLTLIGFQLVLLRKFYPESMQSSSTSSGLNQELEKKVGEISEYFFDYFGLITILFIPVTAIATYIIFINKKHNFAEHIVLNIYTTAQFSIMIFFLSSTFMLIGMEPSIAFIAVSIFSYIYLGYCFKRLYKLSIFGTIWRTIASQMIYMIFVSMVFTILALIGFLIYKSIN